MLGEQFMVGSEVCGAVISVRFQVSFFRPFEAIIILIKDCLAMVAVTTEKIFRCSLPIVKQPTLHHSQVGTFSAIPSFKRFYAVPHSCK